MENTVTAAAAATKDIKGCGNASTCGTGGCNKLNVYDWLHDMTLPAGQFPFDIVEVRFKGTRKEFFINKDKIHLRTGDTVAVESSPGHDIGIVSLTGELVRMQMRKKNIAPGSPEIKTLYRHAKQPDIDKWNSMKKLEEKSMFRARQIAQSLKLNMKLSDVEYQGDGKKATFYYTAEARVDFRELIKKLAEEFHVRIEMRQIGLRQEAGRLGGIGSCGRELCCSTWLTDFKAVATSAARYQNLSINPQKLAGQCGKLKCCLNYELDSYLDALKDIPDPEIKLETQKGTALHRKTDIFKKLLWYSYRREKPADGEEESNTSDHWIKISAQQANEIIELNKKGIKPPDLKSEDVAVDDEPGYKDVVGQDSITRMDRKKKKKKKNKFRGDRERKNNSRSF